MTADRTALPDSVERVIAEIRAHSLKIEVLLGSELGDWADRLQSLRPAGSPSSAALVGKWLARYNETMRQTHPSATFEGEQILRCVNELKALTAAEAQGDYVRVPRDVFDWLMGENGEFECAPENYFRGKEPTYWWRSELRRRIAAAGAQEKGND